MQTKSIIGKKYMNKDIKAVDQKEVTRTLPKDTLRLDNDLFMVHTPVKEIKAGIPFSFQYTTSTLVEGGEAELVVDMKRYRLTKGCLLVILSNRVTMLESMSEDFSAQFLFMSNDFLKSLQISETIELRQLVRNYPVNHISEEAFSALTLYFSMLAHALERTDNPFRREMIFHLTKAYFYGLGYYVHPHVTSETETRSQEVTQHFLELVREHFKQERSISFYADKMNLSPKYVSACIKETMGYSAMECIEQQTLLYAENLLANTKMTIGQISDDLHFDSQSTFGKYFRTHVGIGPKEWRNNIFQKGK